jgi:hypothetical protein
MKWKEFLKSGVAVVAKLDETDLDNPSKFEELTDEVGVFMENVDDLVEFLPIGFSFIAKLLVDNPLTDALQREYVHKPLAETLVQAWKVADKVEATEEGSVAAFVEGAPDLRGAPVPAV